MGTIVLASHDPNAIVGPSGYGTPGFVQDQGVWPYTVFFENSGSVAAQDVTVSEQLNSNLDWSTLRLGSLGFGSLNVNVPDGLTQYQTTVAYQNADGSSLNVKVSFIFNEQTGALTATFTSIDPATGLPPAGINDGFLPPDNSAHVGEGFIGFTIEPKSDLATGAAIDAAASIVFDTNAPVVTKTFTNTIDAGAPTSSVKALDPAISSTSFTVNWSGSDDAGGAGVANYDVFVSDNGGPFTAFQTATTATSATFTGVFGHTYTFYSIATDNVGNRQPTPFGAPATTQLVEGKDANGRYVVAVYSDVLARAPEPIGLDYWTNLLDTGTAVTAVAQGIAHSAEYYAKFVIKPAYLSLLGRPADDAGVAYWVQQMLHGVTDQEIQAGFVASDEFYANAGGTNVAWIDSIYQLLLGRNADAAGEQYWNGQLLAGVSRSDVALRIANSAENNTQLINADYEHYLGRPADSDGLNYWLSQFAAGYTNEDIIAGFTGSAEYYKEHTS